jgi:hypothetical protein
MEVTFSHGEYVFSVVQMQESVVPEGETYSRRSIFKFFQPSSNNGFTAVPSTSSIK